MTTSTLRVLLVDDEASLREPLAKFLARECGYAVVTAADMQEALACVAAEQGMFDVALIDDMLMPAPGRQPEPLGIKLMQQIYARYPNIECILFTGWGMGAGLDALRAGAYRYIRKPFDLAELPILIEHAAEYRSLKRAAQEKPTYERLLETSVALHSERDLQEALDTICRVTAQLFCADHSGLVRFNPDYTHGHVVAEYPDVGTRNARIPVSGVVLEERLIASGEPLIIDDVSIEMALGTVRDVFRRFDIQSTLIVPVLLKGQVLGSFSLDSIGRLRVFTEDDVKLCKMFAAQVAAAVENAQLFTAIKRHADQLETLRRTTLAITSQMDRDTLLRTIIQQAVFLLGAKSGGIYECSRERDTLTIIADYGHEVDLHGRTLRAGEGMAGKLMQSGEAFLIVDDYNRWPGRADHYVNGRIFGAVLEVALKWQERTIGILCVDDLVGRKFTKEDASLLGLFADHAAIALVNAGITAELGERKAHLERLIASSPSGVIANDGQGQITAFSSQAQAILQYDPDEVLGEQVDLVYVDPLEPFRIGELLRAAPDGKLTNYRTSIRSRAGEQIPIRLAATQLYNAQGNPTGSVGYFEDLRAIKQTQDRLRLLLKASNVVARAEHLHDGLQRLAELMIDFLHTSFCRIFLLAENQQDLIAEAVYPHQHPLDQQEWGLTLGELISSKEWPALEGLIDRRELVLLQHGDTQSQAMLSEWAQRCGIDDQLQSLLAIPLLTNMRMVGLLLLGELRPWKQAPISQETCELAVAIADQTATLIDRIRMYEITDRRRQLLTALDEASRHIRAEKETSKLLQEIVRLAAELVGCTAGCLYINHAQIAELDIDVVYGMPFDLMGSRLQHDDDPIGSIARSGRSQIFYTAGWVTHRSIAWPQHIHSVAAVPLKQAGEVEAVLLVLDSTGQQLFTQADLDILERFATQASIALQTSRLLSQEQRMFTRLQILHRIGNYIELSGDIKKILHIVLTGVTAGYGLGFNRAALFLLDERRESLVGLMGIGPLDLRQAQAAWASDEHEPKDFRQYLEMLEQGGIQTTPLGERITGLRLPVRDGLSDSFSHVVLQKRWVKIDQRSQLEIPSDFITAVQPSLPLVIVPLSVRQQVIGLLVADNKFTHSPITHSDVEDLLIFANTAAIAIDNVRLFHETEQGRKRLRSFYEASNALVSSHDPEQVLQDMVERARTATGARRVSLILIDELGQVRDLTTAGVAPPDITGMVPGNGLSMEVMRLGIPQTIENVDKQHDRINPGPFWHNVAAALCLPVSLEGQRIGVMWFHYDQPRYFATSEIEAIQLYVNQAAIAYDNARWIKELQHMRQAAESLATVAGLDDVLEQIVRYAQMMLQADSAVIWSYDAQRDRFLPKNSVAIGILPDVWEAFRREEPSRDGATYTVIENGWLGVPDVGSAQHILSETTCRLLAGIGANSFQSIALSVGDEKLGVLYVNYERRRSFDEMDRWAIQTFANHAALALKKARLLEQVSKAHDAARVVAEVTVLENLDSTLQSIVEGTQNVLGSSAVTLYTYDQSKDLMGHPPIMVGVHYPERASGLTGVFKDSIVLEMLKRDEMYIADNLSADPLFKSTRFAIDEQIASAVAIPLKVGHETVGVMFINYRLPHRFTSDELINIGLFANQAAVAIRNAQLYEWSQKRTRVLQTLHEAGHMVTGSLDLDKILAAIVEHVWKLNSSSGKEAHFSHLALVDGEKLSFIAAYPPEHLPGLQTRVGTIDLSQNKRCGVTGRVALSGESLLIHDVTQETDYIAYQTYVRSELAVPIKIGEKVVGVINVEHPERNAFVLQDQHDLEALAGYAASAIQNAHWYSEVRQQVEHTRRAYEETQRRLQEQTLLHNVALAASSTLQLGKVLQAVTQSIADALGYESVGIYLVDEAWQAFTGPTYYAGLWPREVNENKDRGITGRVVRTGQSALVPDVSQDPDYVPGTPDTRSEICVPLRLTHRIVGIINVESTRLNAVTEHDLRLIETIAGQVVHWIENARLYTQLERTKETLAARGAVAWMGMVSSTWRHAIEGHALTIAEEIDTLRVSLPATARSPSIERRLAKIERVARLILDKPITPPLSSEEGVISVPVNDLIRERLRQLQKNDPYKSVDFAFRPHMDDGATVRISPEWLRRVFDILIDNAVEAVSRSIVKHITVTTRCNSEWVTVAVNDTGHGIQPELRPQLFRQPIAKSKGEKGMGMGLLLAQTIAQTYGGDIQEDLSAGGGTTVLIRLPPELS